MPKFIVDVRDDTFTYQDMENAIAKHRGTEKGTFVAIISKEVDIEISEEKDIDLVWRNKKK